MKKLSKLLLTLLTFLLIVSSCSDDSSTNPKDIDPEITSIIPDTGRIGDVITISGTNFGIEQGSGFVSFAGTEATEYVSWSDTEIEVKVPTGAESGKLWVEVDSKKSNEVDFTVEGREIEYGTVTDIDANVYKTVKIGNQWWMAENLNVSHYLNGDPIPQVTDPDEWAILMTGAWCYYDNDPANGEIYGKLYNWYSVNDPRGLAPEGWHVPSDEEWTELEDCLKSNSEYWCDNNSYAIAKSLASKDLWEVSSDPCDIGNNLSANNASGFTGRPGGYRNYSIGNFYHIGYNGYWWSSTEYKYISAGAIYLLLSYNYSSLGWGYNNKRNGRSVRCVRD
jgi:uncharacterized protein (TIGR02145 family)